MNNLGRDKIEWNQDTWMKIDMAVNDEVKRTRIAAQFLPIYTALTPAARSVPAEGIRDDAGPLTIDDGAELPLVENSIPFTLTKQQYVAESQGLGTAATLATRAANILAGEMDRQIFQTSDVNLVRTANEWNQIVEVEPASGPGGYGENTFRRVASAYAALQGQRHYGPYALVMSAPEFADAHAPLRSTLIMPADRIKPLMSAGFYGTGTVPERTALMISAGGNTVDLAIAVEPVTAFVQVQGGELYHFRVYQRFALRVKKGTAVVLLRFTA